MVESKTPAMHCSQLAEQVMGNLVLEMQHGKWLSVPGGRIIFIQQLLSPLIVGSFGDVMQLTEIFYRYPAFFAF